MDLKRVLRNIIIILLSISFFLLFFLFAAWILFRVYNFGSGSNEDAEDLKKYKFLKYNQRTNLSSVGFVTLDQDLGSDGYVTYVDEREDTTITTIISDFDSDEYVCSGSCFCDEPSRRSLVAGTLSRGVKILVAAVSSALVYKIAETKFKEECVQKFADDCSSENSIRSEVAVCAKAKADEYIFPEASIPDDETEPTFPKDYLCSGKCIPRNLRYEFEVAKTTEGFDKQYLKIFEHNLDRLQFRSLSYGCEKITLESVITVQLPRDEYWGHLDVTEIQFVEKYFCQNYLHFHCERQSLVEMEIDNFGEATFTTNGMCCGLNDHIDDPVPNPSVKCVKTVPKEVKK